MYELSKREILKAKKELVELHKRCIKTWLVQRDMSLKKRNKFFIIYDYYINEKNIHEYFHRPIKLFIYALITDRLPEIRNYFNDKQPKKRRRKNGSIRSSR